MSAKTELAPRQQTLPAVEPGRAVTPLDLINKMVESGVDADQLGKMLDLQERWEANEARKAFAVAMNAFEAECPVIRKNREGDKATYADLAFTVATIRPLLEKHGFSVSFDTELSFSETGDAAVMKAICYVTHISGHTRQNSFSTPVDAGPMTKDGRRVMNSAQSTASARSYCKRYALGDALNLVFADDLDDDGNSIGATFISDEEAATIREHIEALGDDIDVAKFCRWLQVDGIDDIPASKYQMALTQLKRKQAAVSK